MNVPTRAFTVLAIVLASGAGLPAVRAQSANCGLGSTAAFCDTFDQPQNGGTRSGDLNSVVWGASRATGRMNIGSENNAWTPGTMTTCNGSAFSPPPSDIKICNGQVREVTNDGGGVTVLAMYPKQPFDWAGRTGRVTFDVSNNSKGSHAAWPEFWITDKPVPAPRAHEASWRSLPRHGLGLSFAGFVDANGNANSCPGGSPTYVGVDNALVVRNWVLQDMPIRGIDCVRASTSPGQLNHYEIRVSQNQIDVFGTDAGTTSPLKHLAVIANANLSLTRGLIWIEDAHYAGDKFGAAQGTNTFTWDNVGFDGPFTYRDLSYDALDNNTAGPGGTINLGKSSQPGQSASWNVLGVNADQPAEAARVLFNFFVYQPVTLTVTVNGHAHSVPWPYPDNLGYSWRTLDVQIPQSELVNGTNVVQLGGNQAMVSSNVNIVLVNVGGQPPAPTNTPVPDATATPTPTATNTPVPPAATPTSTPTAVPVASCEALVRINGVEQWLAKPPEFCAP